MSSLKMGCDQQHGLEGALVAEPVVAFKKGVLRQFFCHHRCPDSLGLAFRPAGSDSGTPSHASASRGVWGEVTRISTNRPAPAEVVALARNRDEDFSPNVCGGVEALAGSCWND